MRRLHDRVLLGRRHVLQTRHGSRERVEQFLQRGQMSLRRQVACPGGCAEAVRDASEPDLGEPRLAALAEAGLAAFGEARLRDRGRGGIRLRAVVLAELPFGTAWVPGASERLLGPVALLGRLHLAETATMGSA